jgi:autotransporter-associated beta strand protein
MLASVRVSAIVLLLVLCPGVAPAQTTYTWTGLDSDDNWFSPLNWSAVGPGSPPPLNNIVNTFVVLDGNTRTTNALDYSFSANSLSFAAGAGNFVVGTTTAETLTLGTGGLTIAAGNANNQTFNANLALGANQTWTHNGSGLFTVGGSIDTGGFVLTVDGSGASTVSGVISGTGGLVKTGAGTLTLGGANTFTGTTTITGGTLVVAADSAFGTAPGSATAGKIVIDGGTFRATSGFTLNANRGVALGPGVGTGTGTIDVAAGQTLSYGGVLANNGGSGGFVKTGPGTLVLSGTNTFTGPVSITGGVLSIGSTNQITPSSTATVTIDGGTLRHTASAAVTFMNVNHPIVIGDSGGTIDIPSATGILIYAATATAVRITPATAGAGVVTKTGSGTLRLTNSGFSSTMTVQRLVVLGGLWQGGLDGVFGAVPGSVLADQITLNGGGISSNAGFTLNANRGITLGASGGTINTSSNLTYSGPITGPGGLTKTGANTLILGGASNDYVGGTTIAAGTLQLINGDNRLPATGNLSFTGGTLDLNTRSQSINDLNSTGSAGVITTAAAGNVTLTVGNGNGNGLYGGIIQNGAGTTSLAKIGNGTQTLTGANTYTGATTVSGGTLAVGTGGSLAAGSAVAVNNGGTLAGTGTVNGTVTVNQGGTLAPGSGGAGVLTIGGNTIIETSGVNGPGALAITAGAPGASTALAIAGASTTFDFKTGSRLDLSLQSGFGAAGTYTLISMPGGSGGNVLVDASPTGDGQVLGTFVKGTGATGPVLIVPSGFALAAGDTFTLSRSGDAVVLTFAPVPEPGLVLGIAAGVLAAAAARRRFALAASRDRVLISK